MKFTTTAAFIFMLFSCSKKHDSIEPAQAPAIANEKAFNCTFGLTEFNKSKNAVAEDVAVTKKKLEALPGPIGVPTATIYLDFDGQFVSGTYWNTNGDINATAANLPFSDIEKIIQRVSEDFIPFNVTVTTSQAVYNNTNPHKRIRVIITEAWEWYGVAGGAAFNNSFQWGNNTPAFVFSTLLSYNEKWIAEAISHEVGHTLSLQHQANYSSGCVMLTEYFAGQGQGQTGWAPIMGSNYFQNVTTWHKGTTNGGCGVVQDDVAVLTAILGAKEDEGDATHKSEPVAHNSTAIINNSTDVDMFYVELKNAATITAMPSCLDNCIGANVDLQIKVYDKNGGLVQTSTDPYSLMANSPVAAGKYFVSVQTIANANQSRYGMLGSYQLQVMPQ